MKPFFGPTQNTQRHGGLRQWDSLPRFFLVSREVPPNVQLPPNCFCEADMDKALKAAEEDDSSSSSSSSSDSDDSSESSFGLKTSKKPKAKAKPKHRKPVQVKETSKPQPEEEKEQAEDHKPDASMAPSISEVKSERSAVSGATGADKPLTPSALMDKANSCYKGMEQITAWALYQGLKSKDVDGKIGRSLDVTAKMEAHRASDPAMAELAGKLTGEVDRVSQQSELFSSLSSPVDLAPTLQAKATMILEILKTWKLEETTAFLSDIARRTCEGLISSQGKDRTMFGFLSAKNNLGWDGFGLFMVKDSLQSQEQDCLQLVASIQLNTLNYFMDKLRNVGDSLAPILDSIPKAWYMPELCRTGV